MSKKYFAPNLVKLALMLAVCLLVVSWNPAGIFDPVRWIFQKIAYPFEKTFYIVGRDLSRAMNFFGSISDLRDDNERLIRENDSLSRELAGLSDVRRENDILREQLRLAPREKLNLEPSFVIGQDSQGLGSWILIGKGSDEGVLKGMPVVVSDGILIGKVDEVYSDSAKVKLLTDSSSSVNGVDLETGSKGIVRGEYGLGLVLDMVTQEDSLNEGDTIVTSGLGSEIPKGLLIGKVQEIRSSGDKLFQQALLVPRVKYSNLDMVFVVK